MYKGIKHIYIYIYILIYIYVYIYINIYICISLSIYITLHKLQINYLCNIQKLCGTHISTKKNFPGNVRLCLRQCQNSGIISRSFLVMPHDEGHTLTRIYDHLQAVKKRCMKHWLSNRPKY